MVQAQHDPQQRGAEWPTILRRKQLIVDEDAAPPPEPVAPDPVAAANLVKMQARLDLIDMWPEAPTTIAATGLSPMLLEELALKTLHYAGPSTLDHIARRTGVSLAVAEEISDRLRAANLVETQGISEYQGQQYSLLGIRLLLNERGEQRVADALSRSRYAGLAPIPLEQYMEVTERQKGRFRQASAEQIEKALEPFVMSAALKESLCFTFHAGRPALIYGDSGNGKTAMVDAFARSFPHPVLIPSAVYVNGQVIRIFDSSLHQRDDLSDALDAHAGADAQQPSVLRRTTKTLDERWIAIRRPVVVVGGELTAESLELAFDQVGGFYQAPPHLKAQHGIFVIDDFGRQRLRPDELLNRWIVPLERGYDLLTLKSGERLVVPFDTNVLFSTNLSPADLADEAFLRRIPYKVQMTNPGPHEIAEIARRECRRRGLVWDEVAIQALVEALFSPGRPAAKAVYPRDILQIIEDNAHLRGVMPALTRPAIEAACRVYFVNEPIPVQPAARDEQRREIDRYYVSAEA